MIGGGWLGHSSGHDIGRPASPPGRIERPIRRRSGRPPHVTPAPPVGRIAWASGGRPRPAGPGPLVITIAGMSRAMAVRDIGDPLVARSRRISVSRSSVVSKKHGRKGPRPACRAFTRGYDGTKEASHGP